MTREVHEALLEAARAKRPSLDCSLDLGRSRTRVEINDDGWVWNGTRYPFLESCRERTIYHWVEGGFHPAQRFGSALVKLVPTEYGPPTFEIDGIKMLPSARISPWEDAARKVALVKPRGKRILDTCAGLGYFAAHGVALGAAEIHSWESSPEVLWLRSLNPWSPDGGNGLYLAEGDVTRALPGIADRSFDAILHDPPRFGTAGELYSLKFYEELFRILRPRGMLFHYTGMPNRLTSGRDVPGEVLKRLRRVGFNADREGDGVLAQRV